MKQESGDTLATVVLPGGQGLVIDDFLGCEAFAALWRYYCTLDFSHVHTGGYEKVFRLYDGWALQGQSHDLRIDAARLPYPPPADTDALNPLSRLIRAMLAEPAVADFLKDAPPWDEIGFTSYLYPAGAGLGWHEDAGRAGAFIYYLHPAWHESWGGELLIEAAGEIGAVSGNSPDAPRAASFRDFYARYSDPSAATPMYGSYIAPRPNRLVLIRGGARHSIRKVDAAAGEAFRASLSGFFRTHEENAGGD